MPSVKRAYFETKQMPRKLNLFMSWVRSHLQSFPWPTSMNFLWNFGSLVEFSYVVQIVTELLLASKNTNEMLHAFASVQHIRKEVIFGGKFKLMYATGASFVFLFLHIRKALVFGCYTYISSTWLQGYWYISFLLQQVTLRMFYHGVR